MTAERSLIVNADDYGLTPSVSAGIRQAHLHGVVTSTTAMMNGADVEAQLTRALEECPALGLGVHLVLTKGKPLEPPHAVRSLVQLGGGDEFPSLAQFLAGKEQLDITEVQAEWRAQVEAFVRMTGRPPTHLDSHHHSAYLSAPLFGALLDLAGECGCPIRLPLDRSDPEQAHLGIPPEQFGHLRQAGCHASMRHPDYFEAGFYGAAATVELLNTILARLPKGTTELMCHPALPHGGLQDISSYNFHRAQELEALTSPGLRAAAEAAGATLKNFGDLRAT